MHEKIVIAPSVNGNELLRTLARYGVNTIGLRIMDISCTECILSLSE